MNTQQNTDQLKNSFNTKFNQVCNDTMIKGFETLTKSGWVHLEEELKLAFSKFVSDFKDSLQTSPALLSLIKQDSHVPAKRDIFISYYWGQKPQYIHKEKALSLCNSLKKKYTVWLDQNDFGIHPTVAQDLSHAIDDCSLLICLLTKEYCSSNNCKGEFTWALNYRKPIIAVLLDPIETLDRDIKFYIMQRSYFESRKSSPTLDSNWGNLNVSSLLTDILKRIEIELHQTPATRTNPNLMPNSM
jgi:hypothetical protein